MDGQTHMCLFINVCSPVGLAGCCKSSGFMFLFLNLYKISLNKVGMYFVEIQNKFCFQLRLKKSPVSGHTCTCTCSSTSCTQLLEPD